MSGEEMKATIRTAAAAWNAGDVDGFLSMFDSSLLHHGLAPEPLDAEGNRVFYEGMQSSFPGSQILIRDAIAEGDRVALRFDFAGEHKGEFLGVAPTGRHVLMHAMTIMRFEDGSVVERWMTADLMGLMSQIG